MYYELQPQKSKINWEKSSRLESPWHRGDLRRCLDFYTDVFGFDMVELIDAIADGYCYPAQFLNFKTDNLRVYGGDKLFGFPDYIQV